MLFALYDLDYMVAGGQNCRLGAGKFHAVDNQGTELKLPASACASGA